MAVRASSHRPSIAKAAELCQTALPMLFRSRLLTFLVGGFLLGLGIVLLESTEPWNSSSLQRWASDKAPLGMLLTSGALIVLGLILTLSVAVSVIALSGFRESVLEPPEGGALLGGEAPIRLRLTPRGTVRVASAQLRLITEERASYEEKFPEMETWKADGGVEAGFFRSVMEVHRWSTDLELPSELSGSWEQIIPVPIPLELPPSFEWGRHAVETRLELEIFLVGSMDLRLERELHVLPRQA
jgi:hypothetical protein